jgi:uncharacterized membrane protein (Fun14 family)
MAESGTDAERSGGLAPFQRAVLALLVLILIASVAARALLAEPAAASGAAEGLGFSATASGSGAAAEPTGFEKYLPFATEGSLFGLVGFALGYTTRKLIRVALILIALGFVITQALAYAGKLEVDWGGLVERFNEFVLNLRRDQTVSKILSYRVPSLGALVAGWLVGLRRG